MLKTQGGSDHFWRFRCRFASLHYTILHYTPLHYITLHYTPQHGNYNYTTTQLHNYTTTQLDSTTPQLQLQLHNYTTTLHYTPLH